MRQTDRLAHDEVLHSRMRWFINLRWLAGSVVLLASLADIFWLHWYESAMFMTLAGSAILVYNHVLWMVLRSIRHSGPALRHLAWVQILLDVACLTLLTLWTGGEQSPVRGFFVFHMIFASLLLSPAAAYGAAVISVGLLLTGMTFSQDFPTTRDGWLRLAGWIILLLLTVYLVNGIAQRLRRHRHRLLLQNRRILEMHRQLTEQQQALIQHEKLAAMGQMAAGIAHEIANPLANLDSILQLMQRNPQRMNETNLQKLSHESERIRHTIRQMSEFVHPSNGQWRVVAVDDLARMGMEMVRFDRRRRSVELRLETSGENPLVRVQPQAMQQVLINLLLNAMDALADHPQAMITVRTSAAGDMARIEVIDNGPGIPANVRARVFEPFFTTKPVGKGTGLGLAISYNLVTALGGKISLESEPGKGVRVTIDLPTAPRAEASGPGSRGETVAAESTD